VHEIGTLVPEETKDLKYLNRQNVTWKIMGIQKPSITMQ